MKKLFKSAHKRILLRVIPEGLYCYTTMKIIFSKSGFRMKVKYCPYLNLKKSKCKLTGIKDILLSDSCKVCGINYGDLK